MTLKKVQMAKGSPFLIAPEIKPPYSSILTIVGEPRQIKTKWRDEQNVIDVLIKEPMKEAELKALGLDTDVKDRLESKSRSYFINGTSFNYLIDTIGEDETKWDKKTIEIEPLMLLVNGERKEILYVKGSI